MEFRPSNPDRIYRQQLLDTFSRYLIIVLITISLTLFFVELVWLRQPIEHISQEESLPIREPEPKSVYFA